MNVAKFEQLLQHTTHRDRADEVQAHVEREPEKLLPILLKHFCGVDRTTIGMASMVTGNLARKYPEWLQPYQERIYRASVQHFHPGPRRNAIRYFSELPVLLEEGHRIPEWVTSKDFLYCFPVGTTASKSRKKEGSGSLAYIEPELEGLLLDHILERIGDPQEIAAPKAFGMRVGQNLCLKYPDIAPELCTVIASAMEYGTSGVKNRGKKTLDLLNRLVDL